MSRSAWSIFRVELADALVRMWRQSFESAVGVKELYPFQEQREFLLTEIVPNNAVRVVCHGANVVGFIAASRESMSQLYLSGSHQRRGIGTMLLDWAKAQSNGTLLLHTFARNVAASSPSANSMI